MFQNVSATVVLFVLNLSYGKKNLFECKFISQKDTWIVTLFNSGITTQLWIMSGVWPGWFQEEGGYDPNVSDKAYCCLFHQYRPIHLHVFTNLLSSLSSIFKASWRFSSFFPVHDKTYYCVEDCPTAAENLGHMKEEQHTTYLQEVGCCSLLVFYLSENSNIPSQMLASFLY